MDSVKVNNRYTQDVSRHLARKALRFVQGDRVAMGEGLRGGTRLASGHNPPSTPTDAFRARKVLQDMWAA